MQNFYQKIISLSVLSLILSVYNITAQNNKFSPVNQSTMVGVGKSFLNDSYLSPLMYEGLTVSLLNERINRTKHFDEKLIFQQKFLIQIAFAKNPSASAKEYYGDISYTGNLLYPIYDNNKLKLFGGGGIHANLGGIYNQRNSNNPGSLKTAVNFDLSGMATYNWRSVTFRWQLSSPFAGIFFTPAFGQSYYEIFSLGNGAGTVQFGSIFNQLALQNYFTVDIPVRNVTIRTGYLGDYYKTEVNDILTKIVSHQFVIGFTVESINFGGKKVRENKIIKSSFY